MSEFQPDLLGGKGKPGRRTPKIRRNARPRIVPAGHADTPGSGPAGETCGSCTYMRDYSYKKTYHKCGARPGDVWKGGRATDVRPLDAACSKWAATIARINGLPATVVAVDEADTIPTAIFGMRKIAVPIVTPEIERANALLHGLAWVEAPGSTPPPPIADLIAAALRAAPDGLTADQVADAIDADLHAVRPRISELAASGAIEKTSDRRRGKAGRPIAVWKLKGKGQ